MGNILDQIVETKRGELIQRRARCSLEQMRRLAAEAAPTRDFYAALAADPPRGVHLIAEIKRKSPSAGLIRPDFDPVAIAQVYQRAGASALSVLTDQPYFDGRLEFLPQVKKAVPLPVLRKDFMIDLYQIYESRASGADAVLLIGEVLTPDLLAEMLDLAFRLGMTSLIEIHERQTLEQLQRVIPFSNERRSLLGINNRDLKTQRTDLATSEQLAELAAKGTIIISESGIKSRADVERLIKAGARGLLIGETLMRSPDVAGAIQELFGGWRSDAP